MRSPTRVLLAGGSIALIVCVNATALALGPDLRGWWLLRLSAFLAAVTALQSVASDPRDLAPALVFSLPPVIALVADGSPTWLIGPLAALLLLAGELDTLSWEAQGDGPMSAVRRRRLLSAGRFAAFAAAASFLVGIAAAGGPRMSGTAAIAAGAVALAALGAVVFRRGAERARAARPPHRRI